MNVFIVGLRRSGTTIFWRTFRQDRRLLCFDEPFNPMLRGLPDENPKGTWDEFIDLHREDPVGFERRFAPIPLDEELATGMSAEQRAYLGWLLERGDRVVCDFVRCAFKLGTLHAIDPDAVLVHLHRAPEAFASSHMLPSGGTWRRKTMNLLRRATFWRRSSDYNNARLEDVIGRSAQSPFGRLLCDRDHDAARVYGAPAVARLLAFWLVHYREVETTGRCLFGDRFVSVGFEAFCEDPGAALAHIYQARGWRIPDLAYERIRPANPGFRPGHRRWKRSWQAAGMWERRVELAEAERARARSLIRRNALHEMTG